jgi:multidrug efflux pump subunit AcrA (membrane-fusion protein)
VDVPNSSGTLLQGEYAQVRFTVGFSGKRLSLPINALLFRPEGTMVAAVGSDSRLTLKKVAVGRDFGNSVEILQGITVEDSVVINPPDALENGEQVVVAGAQASSSPTR